MHYHQLYIHPVHSIHRKNPKTSYIFTHWPNKAKSLVSLFDDVDDTITSSPLRCLSAHLLFFECCPVCNQKQNKNSGEKDFCLKTSILFPIISSFFYFVCVKSFFFFLYLCVLLYLYIPVSLRFSLIRSSIPC